MALSAVSFDRLHDALLDRRAGYSVSARGRQTLKPAWVTGPRVVEDHLVYCVHAGRTLNHVGDQRLSMGPGAAMWIQPGVWHHLVLEPPCTSARVTFHRFHLARGGKAPRLREDVIHLPEAGDVAAMLERLMPEHHLDAALEPLRARCVLAEVLLAMRQHLLRDDADAVGLTPAERRRLLNYIHHNLQQRFTMQTLADQIGTSAAYLAVKFKRRMGVPPQAYIKRARIEHAAALLRESDLTVTDVALAMGYEDVYFFSRQFKEVMGASPKRWRARG